MVKCLNIKNYKEYSIKVLKFCPSLSLFKKRLAKYTKYYYQMGAISANKFAVNITNQACMQHYFTYLLFNSESTKKDKGSNAFW